MFTAEMSNSRLVPSSQKSWTSMSALSMQSPWCRTIRWKRLQKPVVAHMCRCSHFVATLVLGVFVLQLGTQRTPERCSIGHAVSGTLHLADWCRAWPVTAPQEREPLVTHVDAPMEMSHSAQWGWNTMLLPWQHAASAAHKCVRPPPPTDCRIVWDGSREQLNLKAVVVTWGPPKRRTSGPVRFVSYDRCKLWRSSHKVCHADVWPVPHLTENTDTQTPLQRWSWTFRHTLPVY